MVLKQYSQAVYAQLGDVDVIAKLVDEKDISTLGKIILMHGYENDVGVAIAHRHFDLKPDEVMIETTEPNLSVVKPYCWSVIEKEGAVPTVFKYCEDGSWY